MNVEFDHDSVLCGCDLKQLVRFVEGLESRHQVRITRQPSICLTMVRAEDSLEKQEFYLGEALTTECEVEINGIPGYGICLGEEPQRGYCIAVIDSLMHQQVPHEAEIHEFLCFHHNAIQRAEEAEFAQVMSTQVDFKLMEDQ